MRNDEQDAAADHSNAATASHELLRCTRGEETRIYQLRVVAGGAELWRIDAGPGEIRRSVKESHLNGPEEAAALLEEIRRAMTAGGWR